MIDTIPKPLKFQLQVPIENMSIITDSNTGLKSYQLALDSSKSDKSLPPHWEGWVIGLIAVSMATALFLLLRRRFKVQNHPKVMENVQENTLRKELLRQSEAYKQFVAKGYFMVGKNVSVEVVKEQEISDLCDAVASTFTSFSDFLRDKQLSDKDFQFCCLLKSGLSTFELAEIYCVSESAIFKRKQKLKGKLGFNSDDRTLDAILQEF